MIQIRELAVLVTLVVVVVRTEDDCKTETPEFSYVSGLPSLRTRSDETGVRDLNISWSLAQVIYAPHCADAFEVEYQQVGGGRLTWSQWSAMVGCAPFREDPASLQFSCARRISRDQCGHSRHPPGLPAVPPCCSLSRWMDCYTAAP